MSCLIVGWLELDSFFFFKQKTAYEMRISDLSSDVFSSDLIEIEVGQHHHSTLHASDAVKKARDSRSRRGDTGCNDKAGWRRTAPPFGNVGEQSVTPLGHVDERPCGQFTRPALQQNIE